jgi:cytosine/adenosine deaminase-related metal-dependent hydrolase
MILGNAWIVTMDDVGTEHAHGWLRIEDGMVAEVGAGAPGGAFEDLGGAIVTPGLINTHHHLYQTLTRARAQQADLFAWLRELYPTWARIDDEMEYAAARTGLAELALSGCSTVFDHHYVFPRGVSGLVEAEIRAAQELGIRIVA